MSLDRLLLIKKQIEEAKSQQASLQGQMLAIQNQWKKDFGFTDLDAAEKELQKISVELDKQVAEFDKGMKELEAAYDWK